MTRTVKYSLTNCGDGAGARARCCRGWTTCIGAASLALAIHSTDSSASDSKVHAGSFCRVAPTVAAPSTDVSYVGAQIKNVGGTEMHVICPIVRDNTANVGGWDALRIGLFDRSPVSDIECHSYSRNLAGVVLFDGPFSTVGSVAVGWEVLQTPDALTSSADGFCHINCQLPRKYTCPECACDGGDSCFSGIGFYRVQEP